MSGYSGQEPTIVCTTYKNPEVRVIEQDAFAELRRKILENPNCTGTFGRFVLHAAQEGWQIHFDRSAGLVEGYDTIVADMWRDLASEEPALQALGQLTANSFGYNMADDGK